jgi:hypothetical protein
MLQFDLMMAILIFNGKVRLHERFSGQNENRKTRVNGTNQLVGPIRAPVSLKGSFSSRLI